MIAITNPTAVNNEINIIHSLFENGLKLLHIRKPGYPETEIASLLTAIGCDFRNRLVLHSHHHLADTFGINRLHHQKTENEKTNYIFSASTHSIMEFNALENSYAYAFLSPVYPSISKPGYHSETDLCESLKKRTNFNTKLVALGGISAENITETLKKGFDEVALLGSIWNSKNPLENFKKMSTDRPFVLSIAGFDPSGGAGVLADVKTFEQHRVYGLAVVTGNTIQTENSFHSMQWTDLDFVLNSIGKLFGAYDIKAIKIGIVPSLDYLKSIIEEVRKHSAEVKIVWDTVLKSTTEFEFATIENQSILIAILKELYLITPNYIEIKQLNPKQLSAKEIATGLSGHCAILLKGGHNPAEKATDYLFTENKITTFRPMVNSTTQKHGTGCVLSSAIAANLALGFSVETACQQSKRYIEHYLNTNNTLLGYHHV